MRAEPTRAVQATSIPAWDETVDVAVVGFGASGACAAIEAARGGAEVMLLEASSGSGGASALSGGEIYLGGSGGTPIQRAAGFEDRTEDLETYLMMAGGPGRGPGEGVAVTPVKAWPTSTGWSPRAYPTRAPSCPGRSSSRRPTTP